MKRPPDERDHPARILIVDDEAGNRRLLEVMLAPEGFLLQTASNGEEALASVAGQPPDLILLDVMMPGMDGYQVAAAIKCDPATKNIPVIMVTALDGESSRMLGLTAGAEDFLTKPVDRAELCVRVRNLLRLKAYGDYYDKYSRLLEGEADLRAVELRAAEERTRFALESAKVGIWDLNLDSGAARWSETLEAQYGLQPGTFEGTLEAYVGRVHPEDRQAVREALQEALRTGADFSVEHRSVRPDGAVRLMNNIGHVHSGAPGEPRRAVGISLDVTDRRALEKQYQQSQKMEAVGRLASGVAHDFNNLLTVILGFAELVSADAATPSLHKEEVGEIIKAAQRASGLTKQLLAFGRQQVLHEVPLEVNALIREMTGMLDRLIGENIEVTLALAPDLSLVLADRSQMEQVVMNLVVNARDAMPGGGKVTIETANVDYESSTFHESGLVTGQYVLIAVSDTGSGMTKEVQRRIFEPFFTTKETGKGTGLGLSTTYGIVKQSKGYISAYGEVGQGTTFKVYLPRSIGAAPVPAHEPVLAVPAKAGHETVLLVEDEPGVRHLAKRILSSAGYQVLEAANGEDAEKLFAAHADAIDLVVTDVVMPGIGGPELLSRLHVRAPALRALCMSGYTEQSAAHKAGVDRGLPFVQKPFTAAEFVRQVRGALDR